MPIRTICPTTGAIMFKRTPEELSIIELQDKNKKMEDKLNKMERILEGLMDDPEVMKKVKIDE